MTDKMEKQNTESSNGVSAAIQDEAKPFKYASAGVYHWLTVFLVQYFIGNQPFLLMFYFTLHDKFIFCMMDAEREEAKKSDRRPSFRNIFAMQCLPYFYLAVPVVHILVLAVQSYPATTFAIPKSIPETFCYYPLVLLAVVGFVFVAARGKPELRRAFRRNALTSFYRVVLCGDLIDLIQDRVQGWFGSKRVISAHEEELQDTAQAI